MAGEWLKFEKATPDKPEVFAIAAHLDIDPDAVVGKLIRVWSWFDTHTVDGNGRGVTPALLDRIAGVTGFTRAMELEGWIAVTEAGVSLPNFDRHTGETAKGRALGAKRASEHRAKSNAPSVTESVTPALPREEKKREEQKQEQKALVQPTAARSPFLDFWAAYPNKKGKQEAEKTWKRRKLDSSCAELIAHVRLMAATDSDWRRGYVPMGSTYLNQARWEDVPKRPPDSGPVAQSKTLTAIQTLEDMKHGLAGYGTSDGFPETALLGVGSHPGD